MAFNQRINLEILGRFNDEGIGFAFPPPRLFTLPAIPTDPWTGDRKRGLSDEN